MIVIFETFFSFSKHFDRKFACLLFFVFLVSTTISSFSSKSSFSFILPEGKYSVRGIIQDSRTVSAYSSWEEVDVSAAVDSNTWLTETFDNELTELQTSQDVGALAMYAVQSLPYALCNVAGIAKVKTAGG